ncbi:MAG: exodeoxyribonuclease III [Bdellovibrio sp.]|nr:MAG: exodeoxyribonuclease III [Bdellovibrio sp.]
MRIISWNVNGIRACAKKGLLEFVRNHKSDILCLQETKAHLEQCEDPLRNLGFSFANWSSAHRKGYSGVATFSVLKPMGVQCGIDVHAYDCEGRFVISDYGEFELYNIYFPNGGSGEERHHFKQRFLKDLAHHLTPKVTAGKKLIVVGDYNVAHAEIDVFDPVRLSTHSGFLPEEREWFTSFLQLGFVDTFRLYHPNERDKYTWWNYREFARISNRGWRIDYICVSENLRGSLRSAEVMDEIEGSDHCPVAVTLEL